VTTAIFISVVNADTFAVKRRQESTRRMKLITVLM
jgi:hypothetical protein